MHFGARSSRWGSSNVWMFRGIPSGGGAGGEEEEAELPQHPKSWQYYREQHPDVSDPPVLTFGQVDADHFRASSGASLGRHLRNIHAVAPKVRPDFAMNYAMGCRTAYTTRFPGKVIRYIVLPYTRSGLANSPGSVSWCNKCFG